MMDFSARRSSILDRDDDDEGANRYIDLTLIAHLQFTTAPYYTCPNTGSQLGHSGSMQTGAMCGEYSSRSKRPSETFYHVNDILYYSIDV